MSNASLIQDVYKEAQNLKKISHRNIVDLYHAFVESKQLIMIMEYAKDGELLQYLQEKGALPEPDARKILI